MKQITWLNKVYTKVLGIPRINKVTAEDMNEIKDVVNSNALESWSNTNNPIFKSSSGYQKLASGLILQWGATTNITGAGSVNIVFPVAFTASPRISLAANANINAWVTNQTVTGITVNVSGSGAVWWIAVGY